MALWIELLMSGALPIAFALWQIRDVRREQQRRRAQKEREQQGGQQSGQQGPEPQANVSEPPASPD